MNKKLAVAIMLLGLAVFGRILINGWVGDDLGYINHPFIRNFQIGELFASPSSDLGGSAPITGKFFRPVMLVVLAVIFRIGGATPVWYHAVQLGLHLANSWLVYLLLAKLLGRTKAAVLSLVWLVHPINAETVAYVSDLQDVIFMGMGLAGMYRLIYKQDDRWGPALLVAALLAKETALLFVILAGVYIYWFEPKRWLKFGSVTAAGLTGYGIIRWGIAGVGLGGPGDGIWAATGIGERLLTLPKIITYYLQTTVWPVQLAIGQTWKAGASWAGAGIPMLILAGVATAAVAIGIRLNKRGKKSAKVYLFFLVWLGAGILMHSQIIPLEMTVADRWWYFPFVGLLGAVGAAIPKNYIWLVVVAIPLLAVRTWIRTGDYKNALTLYRHDSRLTQSYLVEQALGYELMQRNQLEEAGAHLQKSVSMFATSVNTNSLGVLAFRRNSLDEAIYWFTKSVQLGDNFQAYNNLARLLIIKGQLQQARSVVVTGTDKWPESDNFWYLLAMTEYLTGNHQSALAAAEKATSISPSGQNRYVLQQLQTGGEIKINQ